MDLSTLSQLVPLGGVSVLLVYLLGLLIAERRSWVTERTAMLENAATERARMREEHRADMTRASEDLNRNIEHLRRRVVDLEAEIADLRMRERGL